MMIPKSIATAALRTRYFVLKQSDGITPFTGSLSGADVRLGKAGSVPANAVGVATLVNSVTGLYKLVLDTTDIDTDGELVLEVVKTGVQSIEFSLGQVVEVNVYDAVRFGMTGIRPDAVLTGAVTAGSISTTSFPTNLTVPTGALAGEAHLRFTGNITAALAGQVQKITGYTAGVMTFTSAFSTAPVATDTFVIVNG